MVVQESVRLIVMLTATKEHGKAKCEQYWPCEVDESLEFDSREVVLVSVEEVLPNLIMRKMLIGDQAVTQIQYLTWPDHGAPEESDYEIVAHILKTISEFHNAQNKIIVHCSAGIGRTGSLIAIYNLQHTVKTLQAY